MINYFERQLIDCMLGEFYNLNYFQMLISTFDSTGKSPRQIVIKKGASIGYSTSFLDPRLTASEFVKNMIYFNEMTTIDFFKKKKEKEQYGE